jgi:hypothetical protein
MKSAMPTAASVASHFRVRVTRLLVLGEVSRDVEGSLADWQMFSSEPFGGTVELDFFQNRRLTLDYRSGRAAATADGC